MFTCLGLIIFNPIYLATHGKSSHSLPCKCSLQKELCSTSVLPLSPRAFKAITTSFLNSDLSTGTVLPRSHKLQSLGLLLRSCKVIPLAQLQKEPHSHTQDTAGPECSLSAHCPKPSKENTWNLESSKRRIREENHGTNGQCSVHPLMSHIASSFGNLIHSSLTPTLCLLTYSFMISCVTEFTTLHCAYTSFSSTGLSSSWRQWLSSFI